MRAGARGYLLKSLPRNDLLDTIRAIHAGQKRITAEIAAEIAAHATSDSQTAREIEVLRLVAGGNANKEIAAQLSVTEDTVKGHVKYILAKLGANDRTHALTIVQQVHQGKTEIICAIFRLSGARPSYCAAPSLP